MVGDELPVRPVAELEARQSKKWQARPAGALPLTIAETDFDLAPAVADALREAIERSDTGYARPGAKLSDAFTAFAGTRWRWDIDPACVTAVPDVEVATVELLRVIGGQRTRAVLSSPIYPPFYSWIEETGMTAVDVPLLVDGWRLDLAELERVFATGPAVYLLCNPHNPVGRLHSRDELEELVRIARRHDVVVISDEIHAPLALGGAVFCPLLSVDGAGDIAVTTQSASKTWNLAGLKCAMVIATSRRMSDVVSALPAGMASRTGHLGVIAAAAAYGDSDDWLDRLLLTLLNRRNQLIGLLTNQLPDLNWNPLQATYLAWIDASAYGCGDRPAQLFLEHAHVALQGGVAFGAPQDKGYVRLNFATSAEILALAVERLASVLP